MKIIKKRPVAILILAAAIVISTLIGSYRSLNAEREQVLDTLGADVDLLGTGDIGEADSDTKMRIKIYNVAADEFNASLDNIITGTLARIVGVEPLTIIDIGE